MSQDGVGATNLSVLMGMAGTAERAQNNQEAVSYYNRVLEADPTFSEAWLGKGRAAGWQSTLNNVRVTEALIAFGHAIATADESAKATTIERARDDATAIIAAVYQLARKHFEQFDNLVEPRTLYISVSSQLLDALTDVQRWGRPARATLEQVVLITRQLLDFGVTAEFAELLRAQRDEAVAEIAASDPTYQAPQQESVTLMQREKDKADSDAVGYVVLFIVLFVLAIVGAASR